MIIIITIMPNYGHLYVSKVVVCIYLHVFFELFHICRAILTETNKYDDDKK